MIARGWTCALALSLAAPAAAQDADRWQWEGSLTGLGGVHRADRGTVPAGALVAPAPSSTLAASVTASHDTAAGSVAATVLGVAWDPQSDDRGAYGAARGSGSWPLGTGWRLRATDDLRVQRNAGSGAADFQRNEALIAIERRRENGSGWSLQVADRRRGVDASPELGFSRDSFSVAITAAPERTTRLRLEAGLQAYSTRHDTGSRGFVAADLAWVHRRGVLAAHAEYYSASVSLGFGRGGGGTSAAVISPTPVPTPVPTPIPTAPPEETDSGRYLASESEAPPPSARASTGPEIAVDALLVQPSEEEDDWDFGQTRVGGRVYGSYDLGGGWSVSGYAHLQRRDGKDLLVEGAPHVREDRLWLRATVRRRLTARLSVLVQGAHLSSTVNTAAADFHRTEGSFGVQWSF